MFNAEYYDVPLDDDRTRRTTLQLLDTGVVFMSDGGFIAGAIVQDPFRQWEALVEFGWYATDSSGMRLLNKFVELGRESMLDEVRMTTLSTSPEGVNETLRRYGFNPIEVSHRLLL